jgi:Acetyltransferase (GNAT) domain
MNRFWDFCMRRDFVFKTTDRLSQADKDQFRRLFFKIYGKNMSEEDFSRKYLYTPLGYSYHGLMIGDGQILGACNTVPYRYRYFGREAIFGLSVDLMVDEEHRGGPFNVKCMADLVCQAMRDDGIDFVFGFPNEAAYPCVKRLLGWRDVGELEFYVLPHKIGALVPGLRPMNCPWRLVTAGLVRWPRLPDSAVAAYNIQKVCDAGFEAHRYDGQHHRLDVGQGGTCMYRTYTETNGVRTLYILDVDPLEKTFFREAAQELYHRHSTLTDLMLYVGRLPFTPRPLLRVPASMRPRRIYMCGKLLTPGAFDERLFDIENWNVNLSNFDVR